MRRLVFSALWPLAGLGAAAQDSPGQPIPEGSSARLICYQNGAQALTLNRVSRFAPAHLDGILHFTVETRDGHVHQIYLTGDAACWLDLAPGR